MLLYMLARLIPLIILLIIVRSMMYVDPEQVILILNVVGILLAPFLLVFVMGEHEKEKERKRTGQYGPGFKRD